MSDCCALSSCSTGNIPRKYKCPGHGMECSQVSITTIMHHIKDPWKWAVKEQGYYFCDDPKCAVVYFGEDASIIETSALRTSVGIKDEAKDSLVCYCFGVTIDEASDSRVKSFVLHKTKEHICACEIRNPSGKCCLKDFPKT